MDVTYKDEDKEVMLLCLLHESLDNLVTTMWFSTTNSIDYETVLGALLSEEMRKRFSKKNSTIEAMVVRGRYIERGKNHRGTSRSKSKGMKSKNKCWSCVKSGHLKKDCSKR
jgi:hypothetical protein